MKWIAEALIENGDAVLREVARLAPENGTGAVPAEEIVKQAELTLELMVDALNTRHSAALFERWEAIGRSCSDKDLPMSDIPRTPDILKRATWTVLQGKVEAGEVKLSDLVDGMMVVESVLTDCWFMMVHAYLGSRDIKVAARTERMEALYALTEVLSNECDRSKMYRAIAEQVASITGLARCSLLLFDENKTLQPVAANYPDALDTLVACPADELSCLAAVLSLGGPVILEQGNNPPEIEGLLARYAAPVALLVPLHSGEEDIGMLILDEMRNGQFTQEQMDLAISTASQAALAIEKSQLMAEMETRLKHMAAIGIVARSLTSPLSTEEQMQNLLEMGCALVRADSGIILKREEMFGRYEREAVLGDAGWSRARGLEKLAEWASEHQEPVVWLSGKRDPRFPDIELRVEAAVVAPMLVRDRVVGVIAVGSTRAGEDYTRDELEMFKNFAAQAAVAIENTQLYERLQNTYLGAIGALAAAIEARDPYTVGHSARVTQYAVAIAESMGLSSEDIEEIRLAGLLHDLGKIGVPDHILNKPGRLSEEEYTAIKMHPALSMRIIEPLPHLGNIIPIIYHHHERYDGRGYMEGKSGETIPLGARIIAVADSFEAMTSDRPYRSALSRAEAINEIRINAGSQFDPEVVRHFLKLLEETEVA